MFEEAVGSGGSSSVRHARRKRRKRYGSARERYSSPDAEASPILIYEPVLRNIENYEEIFCT
jgi:hypothetical protein